MRCKNASELQKLSRHQAELLRTRGPREKAELGRARPEGSCWENRVWVTLAVSARAKVIAAHRFVSRCQDFTQLPQSL